MVSGERTQVFSTVDHKTLVRKEDGSFMKKPHNGHYRVQYSIQIPWPWQGRFSGRRGQFHSQMRSCHDLLLVCELQLGDALEALLEVRLHSQWILGL